MEEKTEEWEELKKLFPKGNLLEEGGNSFFFLPELKLPDGFIPSTASALFCPNSVTLDGYASSLYLSVQVTGGPVRNWKAPRVILSKTWYGFSWQFQESMRLAELFRAHISSISKAA